VWASPVGTHSMIAIEAEDAVAFGPSSTPQAIIESWPSIVGTQLLTMLVAATIDMINGQKSYFGLAATETVATINIHGLPLDPIASHLTPRTDLVTVVFPVLLASLLEACGVLLAPIIDVTDCADRAVAFCGMLTTLDTQHGLDRP